jgi:hypothetical protein
MRQCYTSGFALARGLCDRVRSFHGFEIFLEVARDDQRPRYSAVSFAVYAAPLQPPISTVSFASIQANRAAVGFETAKCGLNLCRLPFDVNAMTETQALLFLVLIPFQLIRE